MHFLSTTPRSSNPTAAQVLQKCVTAICLFVCSVVFWVSSFTVELLLLVVQEAAMGVLIALGQVKPQVVKTEVLKVSR
jgi:hypothetical protein